MVVIVILTLKNHAPDFFHISLCSAQILQSHILSFPSSWGLAPISPPIVEVNKEVTEELEDIEAARPPSLFRFEFFWSLKTANMNAWSKQPDPMTAEEHEKILKVIEQAEALEKAEQERVG